MNRVSMCVVSVVAVAAFPIGLNAEDLEVVAGSPMTLSADAQYDQVYLNDNLTILSGVKLTVSMNGSVWLPRADGENVTFLVENGGNLLPASYSNYSYILFGKNGGRGHYIWRGTGDKGICMRVFPAIQADDDGYANVARAEAKMPLFSLRNEGAAVPVRLTLAGGAYLTPDSTDQIFNPDEGTTIDLHSEAGPFMVNLNGRKSQWETGVKDIVINAGAGMVTTSGDGEFVLWNSSGTRGKVTLNVGTNQINWAHRGDFVVTNNVDVVLSADYALPFGRQTGNVRIVADSGRKATVDLSGHEVAVNGLEIDVAHACELKNSADNPARLVLGSDDVDGCLHAGKVSGDVNVEKRGCGTLIVRDAEVMTFAVDGGFLIVSNGTLCCDTLAVTNARVKCVDGGKIEARKWEFGPNSFYEVPDQENSALSSFRVPDSNVCVYKAGAALATCLALPNVSGVYVTEGTLRIGGIAYDNPYWRFTFKKSDGDYVRAAEGERAVFTLGIGKLHLFDMAGRIANYWMNENSVGTAASALEEKSISSAKPYLKVSSGKDSPDYSPLAGSGIWNSVASLTFDLENNYYRGLVYTNKTLAVDDPSSWETVTMRINPGQTVSGYLMSQLAPGVNACRPRDWIVENSPDGIAWEVVDERSFSQPISSNDREYSNGGIPYLFCFAKPKFMPSRSVRIDSGAVLDLSNIDFDDISIANIEVDCDLGGGSVTRFVPAANGRIDLLVDDVSTLPQKFEVLTALETNHAEELSTWKVYCNGIQMSAWRVSLRGTSISVSQPSGLILVVK